MSELKLVIFDMDGTLMDSQAFILLAMERAFQTAGHALPDQSEVMATIGLSLQHVVARLLPELDADENRRMAKHYEQTFLDLRAELGGEVKTPLYPGARAALERLRGVDEVLMGVATGNSRRGLDHAYATHGISHFFTTSQTADTNRSKPHPSMLHQAMADTGVEAGRAVMIGDTEFDMEMGRAAGFATIGVSWGYHPVSRLGAADLIINGFGELDAALNEIWKG
ncbi:MAG: HAD-IA family hydrolase [Rhodobacteraceae bacterium]|nr:HAD-IA family hydrolase [Paracoccaceae bacterium]